METASLLINAERLTGTNHADQTVLPHTFGIDGAKHVLYAVGAGGGGEHFSIE